MYIRKVFPSPPIVHTAFTHMENECHEKMKHSLPSIMEVEGDVTCNGVKQVESGKEY